MLQRSSLPSAVSTEITDSLQRTFNRHWLDVLQEVLWLPENYRQYLIVLAVSLVIGAGMMTQVWLSVQIAEQRYLLRTLDAQRQQIERENSEIIYAIANMTSLRQIEQSALVQGYKPTTARKFVRRDELVRSSVPGLSTATAPVPEVTHRPAIAEQAASPPAVQTSSWIDAVGRGLGAAGEWLSEQAGATTSAVSDLAAQVQTQLTERWMR